MKWGEFIALTGEVAAESPVAEHVRQSGRIQE
jgi:hypothetical protein